MNVNSKGDGETMEKPAEKSGEPITVVTNQNATHRVLRFTTPSPNIPDLEVVIDMRGMGSLRVRWCEKLSRPALEDLLAERKKTGAEARYRRRGDRKSVV